MYCQQLEWKIDPINIVCFLNVYRHLTTNKDERHLFVALSSMLVQTKWLLADICPDPLKSWGELCLIKKKYVECLRQASWES
jgi:hypothetical protein